MEFVVSAYGPFDEIVVLSCPGGLPTGAACEFTPSSSVSPTAVTSVSVTLKITTSRATPTGTFPIVVQADVVGSSAPKTVLATLIVTTAADYAVTVTDSPLSLGVGQHRRICRHTDCPQRLQRPSVDYLRQRRSANVHRRIFCPYFGRN